MRNSDARQRVQSTIGIYKSTLRTTIKREKYLPIFRNRNWKNLITTLWCFGVSIRNEKQGESRNKSLLYK